MILALNYLSLYLRLSINQLIRGWSKPAIWLLAAGTLTDLTPNRTDLLVENAILRQQLIILDRQVKGPRLTNPEQIRLELSDQVYQFLETSIAHCATRHPAPLAPRTFPDLLAAQIEKQPT